MSKTINRGYLKRLAQQGRLELVSSYHFDDQMGESRTKEPLAVRVRKDYDDFVHGVVNLWESDFSSSSGFANQGDNGTIHLHVHSNCFYDFRLKDGEVKPVSQPTFGTSEDFKERVQVFADKVQAQTLMRLVREGYGNQLESNLVTVKFGKKYARVDIGSSGRYMVDVTDGTIYGIKAYGVINRGHRYGNLESIDQWCWGDYRPYKPHGIANPSTMPSLRLVAGGASR